MVHFGAILVFISVLSIVEGSCPADFTENTIHQTCLKVLPTRETWKDARKKCADLGSTLVRVDSEAMVDFMFSDVMQHNSLLSGSDFWLPYNDLWREGDYRTTDGTAVAVLYWYRDPFEPQYKQPNDTRHVENCVSQGVNDGEYTFGMDTSWYDSDCNAKKFAVCELWPGKTEKTTKLVRTDEPELFGEYNAEIIQTLPPMSKIRCAAKCAHNLLCDLIAVPYSKTDAGSCHLMTLNQDDSGGLNPDVNKLIGYKVYWVTKY